MITIEQLTEHKYIFQELDNGLHFHAENENCQYEGVFGLSEENKKNLTENLLHLLWVINPATWRSKEVRNAL